jgi:Domain of unknown function (DUF4136)
MKTMKTWIALAATVLLASLGLPAMVQAQKTSYDFDSTVPFSNFKTYAWTAGTPAGEPFFDRRVETAIDAQLAAKGLTKSETNPDLYVRYHVGLGMQRSLNGWVDGAGGLYGWRGGSGSVDLRFNELPMGALVIDLIDNAKQQLVWRGMGTKELDLQGKPEKRDAAIAKAIEKILKNYPPKGRG